MTAALERLPVGLGEAQGLLFDAVAYAGDPANAARLAALVTENGMPAGRRVAIYRDAYRARLVECLLDDYPTVAHLFGETAFRDLCHDYIRDVPPGGSLNFYGARFADYCLHHAPRHARFASELAALEWALVKAVHESDAQTLTPERLAELSIADWETAALVPSPTLTLLTTTYPVNEYLQLLRDGGAPEPPVEPAPSWVVVCRSGLDVWRIDLPGHLGSVFAALVSGNPLTLALSDVTPDPAAQDELAPPTLAIQQAFAQWMRAGCFSAIAPAVC